MTQKDHRKQEVIHLAEQIFIRKCAMHDVGTETMDRYARQAISAAMKFREVEDEIFGEE